MCCLLHPGDDRNKLQCVFCRETQTQNHIQLSETQRDITQQHTVLTNHTPGGWLTRTLCFCSSWPKTTSLKPLNVRSREVSLWVPQTWEQRSVSEPADSWICSSVWTSWIRFHVSLIPLTTRLHQQTVASPLVAMSQTPTTPGSYITHSAPGQSICQQSLCLFHVFQTPHVQFAWHLSLSWDNPDDITTTWSGFFFLTSQHCLQSHIII